MLPTPENLEVAVGELVATATKFFQLKVPTVGEAPDGQPTWINSATLAPPKIIYGDIPSKQVGDSTPSNLPGIVVQLIDIEDSSARDSVGTVQCHLAVYDDALDRQGYQDVLSLLVAIRNAVWGNQIIGGGFRLCAPYVHCQRLIPNDYPLYFGIVTVSYAMMVPGQRINVGELPADLDQRNLVVNIEDMI
jgi:hypothetical protein